MKRSLWMVTLLAAVLLLAGCGTPVPTAQPTSDATEAATAEATAESTGEPTGDSQFPAAEIENDEGGPDVVSGSVEYTNAFFTAGVAQPIIILEDQGGFVARNRDFIIPVESQVLGQITSDFYTSPFDYSVNIPQEPDATLNDVDQDGETDTGVMIYAVAYWTNTWGDPFLEERDQGGGGWSTAYASTEVSNDRDNYLEVTGGKVLIYAPDAQQGFPSGFGDDNKLYTEDDPIVAIPQGWTVVDLDSEPFTFDRSKHAEVDLIEPEDASSEDFSDMSYTEAFDAMLEKMSKEYAFTEMKNIDWDALGAEFRPRFEEAEQSEDEHAYVLALRDFLWSIPDAHVGADFTLLNDLFLADVAGGIGIAVSETDDGHILVTHVTPDSPADEAGIKFGAEILTWNDQPINDVISGIVPWSSPFSNPEVGRLQQLRYGMRVPIGTEVKIGYQNPSSSPTTATLTGIEENESFAFSSFNVGAPADPLPVEFKMLDNGFGYASINSFFDTDVLTIQLWERMMQTLNENEVPGLIIDMRHNGGGNGWLAEQMAAYFFDERIVTDAGSSYDESTGEFFTDTGDQNTLIPPPQENLRYHGPVTLIVGPACVSACEFFSYYMQLEDRATTVGQYPTAGGGGSVEAFTMPGDIYVQFPFVQHLDPEGNIIIEGSGIVPDVDVPVTLETLTAQFVNGEDVVLNTAIEVVSNPAGGGVTPTAPPTLSTDGDLVTLAQSVEVFESKARENYDDTSAPGTYLYTIPLQTSEDLLFIQGWCTTTDAILAENWTKIRLTVTVNGVDVPLSELGLYEGPLNNNVCRFYWAKFSDWHMGENVVVATMTFTAPLNDGIGDYAAGDHVYEYHVFVAKEE
jgi:C-terminal processing protease CtpA/Prc